MKVQVAFLDRETVIKELVPGEAAKAAAERGDVDGGIQTDEHLL